MRNVRGKRGHTDYFRGKRIPVIPDFPRFCDLVDRMIPIPTGAINYFFKVGVSEDDIISKFIMIISNWVREFHL